MPLLGSNLKGPEGDFRGRGGRGSGKQSRTDPEKGFSVVFKQHATPPKKRKLESHILRKSTRRNKQKRERRPSPSFLPKAREGKDVAGKGGISPAFSRRKKNRGCF